MIDLIRHTSLLAGLMLLVAFVTSLIPGQAGGQIQLTAMMIMLLSYAGGAIFFTGAGLARALLLWPDWRRSVTVAIGVPAILAVGLLLAMPTIAIGNRIHIWGIVLFGRNWLDQTVVVAQKQPPSTKAAISYHEGFIPYSIDSGPPVRVAFHTNAGVIDNWSGIVFDPTGKVMTARGWDAAGNFYAARKVTELFGGDLVSCDHLRAHYYYCSFT